MTQNWIGTIRRIKIEHRWQDLLCIVSIPTNKIKTTWSDILKYKETLDNIKEAIEKEPYNIKAYNDYFELTRIIYEGDKSAKNECLWLRKVTAQKIREGKKGVSEFFELNKKTYLLLAPDDFDSYLIYLEWNRKPEERFYLPRRRIMRQVANALQQLVDDKLDELFLSMPPRTGKTSMLMFFMTWLVGLDSEKSNLYSA